VNDYHITEHLLTEEQKHTDILIMTYDLGFHSPDLHRNNFIQDTGIPRIVSSYPSIFTFTESLSSYFSKCPARDCISDEHISVPSITIWDVRVSVFCVMC
jgi:hypothetical protein